MPHGDFAHVGEARQLALALVEKHEASRETALAATARAIGVSKWSLWALYHGRRKSVGYGTLEALRREYLKLCEAQVRRLVAEMADLKRKCGNDFDPNLDREVARLVRKVRRKREAYG